MKIHERKENNYNQGRPEAKQFFLDNYKKGSDINVSKTAKSLNVSRVTIYKWMQEVNS